MPLPTGTVTFLFTDIVGSTRLWRQHPEAMSAALDCHNDLLRRAIAGQQGHVFKTVGDAFCAVFSSVGAALAAAVAAQRSLCAQDWQPLDPLRVRMALWTGEAMQTGDDYAGYLLSAVSRLVSAGHGGQILLSPTTEAMARDVLPAGVSLRGLGTHQLRDITGLYALFQISCPGLPDDFPPLRTSPTLRHNLPLPMTSFVGREQELAELGRKLASARLLTLIGVGGSGKTRLALQAAWEAAEEYADGVRLIDLAPLTASNLVPHAAAALGVREEPGQLLIQTLAGALQDKTVLLVIDNCEHLIAGCATLAQSLLQACPHLRILTTSREPLGISGEAILPVQPLSLPDPRRLPDWEAVAQYGAVKLFVERAQTASPTFVFSRGNAPAVVQICHRLDGIPLALELAAARVKVLSVEQVGRRLDDRFRLLTGGSRTALPRQQTLRALIDWSYDLLSPPEQILLRRLSVFAGGWTLEAAEQVCAGGEIDEFAVLDLIGHLADKSLVQVEQGEQITRFRLLETIRQYGRERLNQDDETKALLKRHYEHFLTLAETAAPELTGSEQARWLDSLELEHDNLRAALDLSLQEGDPEPGLRLASALHRFWYIRGYLREGRGRLEAILARGEDSSASPARAKALSGVGILAWAQGDHAAARACLQQALSIQSARGDQSEIASCLNNLANIASMEEDFAAAWPLYEQSLALYRTVGDTSKVAVLLGNLGGLAKDAGDLERARAFFEESLTLHHRQGNPGARADVLENLAQLARDVDDPQDALALWRECLLLRRDLGDLWGIANALDNMASTCCPADAALTVRLLGAAQAVRGPLGVPRPPPAESRYQADLAAARARLDQAAAAAAWSEGLVMPAAEAISEALRVVA